MPGALPTFGDFFQELGAGLLAVEGAGLGFLLRNAEEETFGHGVVGRLGLDCAERALSAVDVAGDVLGATLGDELVDRSALGREGRVDAGGDDRSRFGRLRAVRFRSVNLTGEAGGAGAAGLELRGASRVTGGSPPCRPA